MWLRVWEAVYFKLGFPTGRDSATFRDSGTAKTFLSRDKGTTGQKFLYCPGTKGQRDKLKILPRDGTGRDSQNLGRDGPGQPKSGTGRFKFQLKPCSKTFPYLPSEQCKKPTLATAKFAAFLKFNLGKKDNL